MRLHSSLLVRPVGATITRRSCKRSKDCRRRPLLIKSFTLAPVLAASARIAVRRPVPVRRLRHPCTTPNRCSVHIAQCTTLQGRDAAGGPDLCPPTPVPTRGPRWRSTQQGRKTEGGAAGSSRSSAGTGPPQAPQTRWAARRAGAPRGRGPPPTTPPPRWPPPRPPRRRSARAPCRQADEDNRRWRTGNGGVGRRGGGGRWGPRRRRRARSAAWAASRQGYWGGYVSTDS